MHGGRDRGDGTDIAGDWMNIHHNTFPDGDNVRYGSFGVRGRPNQETRVHHNWYQQADHTKVGWAVVNNKREWLGEGDSFGGTRVYRNAYGPDKKPVEKGAEK